MKGYWSHRRDVLSSVLREGLLVTQTRRAVVGVTGRATGHTDETCCRRCYVKGYWSRRRDVLSSVFHEEPLAIQTRRAVVGVT